MEFEVKRGAKLHRDLPETISILLLDSERHPKGAISVFPKSVHKNIVRVEIALGDVSLKPPIEFGADVEL
jgi:hypothetical protein